MISTLWPDPTLPGKPDKCRLNDEFNT